MIVGIVVIVLSSMGGAAWGDPNQWYVDPDGNDACDCSSWENACETIEGAVAKASDGDIIDVNEGTYAGRCVDSVWHYAVDPKGKNITIRSKDPNDPNVVESTIISPFYPFGDCDDAPGNAWRRSCNFADPNEDPNCKLIGVTILTYIDVSYRAAGEEFVVRCDNGSSPTISKCVIKGDYDEGGQSGIDCNDSSAIIKDCNITNNGSYQIIKVRGDSDVTIDHCHIEDNNSIGIYCNGGDVNIVNCTISGSVFTGVYVDPGGGDITVTGSTISGNTDMGVYVDENESDITITGSTISENMHQGIHCYLDSGTIKITNCTANRGLQFHRQYWPFGGRGGYPRL
jgi:hypothetical protein